METPTLKEGKSREGTRRKPREGTRIGTGGRVKDGVSGPTSPPHADVGNRKYWIRYIPTTVRVPSQIQLVRHRN